MKLKISEARKIQLQSQGLREPTPFGIGPEAVVRAIRQIGYVQIDTISVVQRAHHHILWSRVPDYELKWLHDLQAIDKKVFEYWSHAAAYLPMEDFRYCLPRMMRYRAGEKHWWEKDPKMIKFVLKEISKRGPMLARDFENTSGRRAGPWFDRTPAKKALEYLFQEGRLVVSERRGFQKVYELAERYLPADLDTSVPSEKEFARHLIFQTLQANGLATVKEISYLRKGLGPSIAKELKSMIKEGTVSSVTVEKLKDDFFCFSSLEVPPDHRRDKALFAHILSPFDNLVIQRARLKNFFDFNYQIECYVPEPKRKFGYFVLPVLVGDQFVGRIDAKADRPTRTLVIRSLHLEKGIKLESIAESFADGLNRFAKFNACDEIDLSELAPKDRKPLKKHLT